MKKFRWPLLFISLSSMFLVERCLAIPEKFKRPPVNESLEIWGSGRGAINPQQINILVWNIFKGEKELFADSFRELSREKDLILIQEMLSSEKVMNSLKPLPMHFQFGVSFLFSNNLYKTGTLIASKGAIEHSLLKRTEDKEPIVMTPKTAMACEFNLSGLNSKLLVVNIHAINFTKIGPFKRQLLELRPILSRHSGPILFAGDFNTWNSARIDYLKEFVENLGLIEVEFTTDERTRVRDRVIDRVFIKNMIVQNAVSKQNEGSDHNPLLLELSVAPEVR